MSLATRLSAFFLLALALVLAGFSGALYLLARNYLVQEFDKRLENALDTLEVSVDIEPGGLEWEPADRRLREAWTVGRPPCAGPCAMTRRDCGPIGQCKRRRLPIRLAAKGLAFAPQRRDRLQHGPGLAARSAAALARRPVAPGPRAPRR